MERVGGPLRVLVVDDEPDMTDTLATLIEMWGYEAAQAGDGPAALSRVLDFYPDVVLLDLAMPKLNGAEVARRLRLVPPTDHAVVVVVSGCCREEDRERCRVAGCDFFLEKPVHPAALRALLAAQAALLGCA
jgi:two-component system sensor histidine kinase/response regulator